MGPQNSAHRWSRALLAAAWVGPALVSATAALRFQAARSTVSVLLVLALEGAVLMGCARTWRRFALLAFPLVVISAAFSLYVVLYHVPPGQALAFVLAGASLEELTGFLSLWAGSPYLWLAVFLALGYLVLAWCQPDHPIFSRKPFRLLGKRIAATQLTLAFLLPLTVYCAWNSGELMDGVGDDPLVGTAMFFGGELPRARAALSGTDIQKIPYRARSTGEQEVHILVVGESARKDSWSAYGYRRPTTPFVDALRGELILLRDAVADANITSLSVPMILTGLTPDRIDGARIHGSLLDLAKEAGYDTSWLVNQDIGISTFLGVHPDHFYSPLEIQTSLFGRFTLDEQLLPVYRREVSRSGHARFIGLHIMGSHWEYSHRYSPSFQHFGTGTKLTMLSLFDSRGVGAPSIVDAYDNTILYTDWFLHELIEQARKLAVPATLTYFPDHGEDLEALDGRVGHGAPVYTPHAFEIPAFVWVNAAYEKAHPEKVAALRSNASREVRSHDVFTTVADLMGIRWPGFLAQRSFASSEFVPDVTTRYSAGGVLVTRMAPAQPDPQQSAATLRSAAHAAAANTDPATASAAFTRSGSRP